MDFDDKRLPDFVENVRKKKSHNIIVSEINRELTPEKIEKFKKKAKSKQNRRDQKNPGIEVRRIDPITVNQRRMVESYLAGKNILAHGSAGTGKTYVALNLALREILCNGEGWTYKKIIIVRSVVPSREIGFLPGTEEEKAEAYETPYIDIVNELCYDSRDAYQNLKLREKIKFVTTSFLRGVTFNNAVIIMDEIQNFSDQEICTTITRTGKDCRIIMCGDFKQSDLVKWNEKDGIIKMIRTAKEMPSFNTIKFEVDDIVRSGVVKEFLIAREQLNLDVSN